MLKRGDQPLAQEPDGIGDLFHRLAEDGKAYAQAEVNLYKTIGTERAKALQTPAIMLGAAYFLAWGAFLALVATVFVGLAGLMGDFLAGVLTVLIVGGLAGILGYLGAKKAAEVFRGPTGGQP